MEKSRVLCVGVFILISFVFTTCECKTVSSSRENKESVFTSVAKSLASEALSEFQARARRDPRLGFNITMLLPPNLISTNGTSGNASASGLGLISPLTGIPAQIGLIGVKGGILGLKAAVIQTVVLVLFIVFLLAGIAYFACNVGVISCTNLGGSLGGLTGGGGGGGGSLNPFSRNGYDYQNLHRATSAVYNSIEDGQKKYT